MKSYWSPTSLRLVGKAYEIRWQLKQLLEHAEGQNGTISHLLSTRIPGSSAARQPERKRPHLVLVKA